MPYRSFDDQNCSIARTLEIVGERWTLLIMREALLGRGRFADIRRNTGIATNILSDRLDTLVEHGLIERRRYRDRPESYEYSPTTRGYDLNPVIVALMQWGDRHVSGSGHEPRVFIHTACRHDADAQLTCSHCHQPIAPTELRVRPGPGADERQRAEPVLPIVHGEQWPDNTGAA